MKVAISGIKGFLGSHLYKYLTDKGHQVRGIDNLFHPCTQDVPFVYGDVRYSHDVEPLVEWCDVFVHMAAQINVDKSIENPQETMDVNVGGTLVVLEACRKYKKRMVFASTSEVYGSAQTDSMDEFHQLDCQSPYGASKVGADRLCKSYFDTYGMDIRILRNFNTFGPHQNDTSYGGVIAIFTKRALEGKPLNIYGDGRQLRDYMYVEDAMQAYKIAILDRNLKGHVINAGTGKCVNVRHIAKKIIEYTGSPSEILHVPPRPGEVRKLQANIDKIKTYGFKPITDFDSHLKKYVEWHAYQDRKIKQ